MRNVLKKYGVWEYVLFLFGFIVLAKLTYSFVLDELEFSMLNGVALTLGVLFMAAPATIVQIMKKKAGKHGTIKNQYNG